MAFNFIKNVPIKAILRYMRRNVLLFLTITAVLLGLLLGFLLRMTHPSPDAVLLVGFPGEIFMRLLKLIILPLIVSSIMSGKVKFFKFHKYIYLFSTSTGRRNQFPQNRHLDDHLLWMHYYPGHYCEF